ncbi:unnamed protein product [Cyclocybe aegerita]|uniref:FAD-binding FR-type domain-containing protein n=1 Tax=Cyclocybe aegerita TaxID=1973307 RepID=A0A8S0VQJ7_CYCAE|nr:unnamed protein product [Cyclocybe aegerita]
MLLAFSAGFSVYFFLEDPARGAPTLEHASLSPKHFTPTKVISNEDSGSNTKLLELRLPKLLLPKDNPEEIFAPIWSVFIKDDDIQVERPYTPLNGVDDDGRMLFWIKEYPSGEVGRWLHLKKSEDCVEIRGPLKTWMWKEDTWDDVVMISGGTGITPFVQLFNNHISRNPPSNTRFTLLHSSRTPAELPPPTLLNPLSQFAAKHPDRFRFHVFVDEQDGSKASAIVPPLNTGRISEASLKKCLSTGEESSSWWTRLFSKPQEAPPRRILFLVCGPEPNTQRMIGAIAGPYGRNFSQGPVGGILAKLGYNADQVYKL